MHVFVSIVQQIFSEISGTHLNGVVPLGKVPLLLLLLLSHQVRLVLCQTSTDGTGLLLAEIEREVLLALVEDAELCALVGVDDSEAAGDGLADVVAVLRYPRQCGALIFPPYRNFLPALTPHLGAYLQYRVFVILGVRTSC